MPDPRIVAAMSDPGFYPHAPESVEVVHTHASVVFLAGPLVYKIKKPVDFGFMDFTSLEKRRENCLREVDLNRRLAPSVYLGVDKVFLDADGEYSLSGPGEIAEYAVRMKRLDEGKMFASLLSQGLLNRDHVTRLARVLADFHARAATGGEIDAAGRLECVGKNHEEDFAQVEGYVGTILGRELFALLIAYADWFMLRRRRLFDRRVTDGRIRDCHGDLHLAHVCEDRGGIVVFDCIEFNKRFRYSDVAAEVAFFAMDLEANGAWDLSRAFTQAYQEASGDRRMGLLLDFYKCYRATVRGKVNAMAANEADVPQAQREKAVETASAYFDLAARYASRPARPRLVILSGLSATGKSTLARPLARFLDAEVLRTDVIRKSLFNIPPEERVPEALGSGIYSPEATERTYREMRRQAKALLLQRKSVIMDASHQRRRHREQAAETARQGRSAFFVVECTAPEAEVRRRLNRRLTDPAEVSDGRWEVFQAQKKDWEPLDEVPQESRIIVDTSIVPGAEAACRVIRKMLSSR
ncbi:MAG: AAA family ATPase [Proteobacteria bacterium]|nr:AAA family ATPase [Pseudomonadota bacterium]